MNILVIDTSSKLCSVGVKYNNEKIFKTLDEGRTHSETLLPLIDEILKNNNISLDDIDILGVVTGPGSFTGIRIGISTIKAIALAKDIKVVEISSTEVLARNITKASIMKIGIIDARNDQVYAGIYTNDFELLKEFAGSINDFIEIINNLESNLSCGAESYHDCRYAFSGTGIIHKEYILKNIENNNLEVVFLEDINQNIEKILDGIEVKIKKEEFKDGREIIPNYLKPSNAERKDK